MSETHFYAPLSDGAFADLRNDLLSAGFACALSQTGASALCTKGPARFRLFSDFDMFRVYQEAGTDADFQAVDAHVKDHVTVNGQTMTEGESTASPVFKALERALESLDAMTGQQVVTAHGAVLGIIGDDWTPPNEDASADDRVGYIERAVKAAKEGVEKAATLDAQMRKRAYDAAMKALETAKSAAGETAKSLGITLLLGPGAGMLHAASQAAPETTKTVEDRLRAAAQSIEETAKQVPGFLFWWGTFAVTWQVVLTAGALYVGYRYYVKPKMGGPRAAR